MQIPFAVGSGKLVHSWQRWRARSLPVMLISNAASMVAGSMVPATVSSAFPLDLFDGVSLHTTYLAQP